MKWKLNIVGIIIEQNYFTHLSYQVSALDSFILLAHHLNIPQFTWDKSREVNIAIVIYLLLRTIWQLLLSITSHRSRSPSPSRAPPRSASSPSSGCWDPRSAPGPAPRPRPCRSSPCNSQRSNWLWFVVLLISSLYINRCNQGNCSFTSVRASTLPCWAELCCWGLQLTAWACCNNQGQKSDVRATFNPNSQ